MNVSSLRNLLAHLPNLETSECMDGSIVLRFDGMLDYTLIQKWLQENDAELRISPNNLILKRVTETARYETDRIQADACGGIHCGPILQHQHLQVSTTSQTLDAFLRRPDVLKITIGMTSVYVNELKPSIVKDGLAHLKRRGLITPTVKCCKWPSSSTTQKRAAVARRKSRNWLRLFQ